jgi:predicted ATP-binding protein involved in virulence
MRIKNLKLKSIGPFKNADIEFISSDDNLDSPPVVIITGENGTGKSIILDAIRSLLMGVLGNVEREITASKEFLMSSNIVINGKQLELESHNKFQGGDKFETNNLQINKLFKAHTDVSFKSDFIFDYWTSKLANDSFNITSIIALDTVNYLGNVLSGVHRNVEVTKIITFFDYLRDSKEEDERKIGQVLYDLLEQIVNLSIGEGKLSHISRVTLKPIIKLRQKEISLDKLSSGNLYLVQRLTSLLSQVYSICVINNIPISDYKTIRGVLLIDEAENHLHPKWQKLFLRNILTLFPHLQLIVTTHSPFIVSSIENSKVYVCNNAIDYCTITEETSIYSNKPVEEILMSPLFNTNNFNSEIEDLISKRKIAAASGDHKQVEEIEKTLLGKNPEYFNYLNIEQLIKSIKK